MRIKPITFTTESVEGIQKDLKTQTRRVVVPQPITSQFINYNVQIDDKAAMICGEDTTRPIESIPLTIRPGDILWVRETWGTITKGVGFSAYEEYVCKAGYVGDAVEKWRSPRFMPKAAARLFLKVNDVRVERVQDIGEGDAMAEGVRLGPEWSEEASCVAKYRRIWNSLNTKRGFPWAANPWVWVYTFEKAERPEGWPECNG